MNLPTSIPKPVPKTRRERWARGIATLVFAGAVVVTIRSALQMPGSMVMPGGWSMTMMWMAMPGQTIWRAAVMFLVMWQAMMIAMMLPAYWPMVELSQRVAASTVEKRPWLSVLLMAGGYFLVWLLFGAGAFAVGMFLSNTAMKSVVFSRMVPLGIGAGLLISGVYQLSPWKHTCLRYCRSPLMFLADVWRPGPAGAVRAGIAHGGYCVGCCWGLMTIQLLLGVMNLGIMIAVAAAITIEKLWRQGHILANFSGAGALSYGIYLVIVNLPPI